MNFPGFGSVEANQNFVSDANTILCLCTYQSISQRDFNSIPQVERTRKLSCWHILSVSVGVFALVVSAVILVANVTYYLNEDHMLER